MAFSISPNTFAGIPIERIIAATVLRGETLEKNMINVFTDIKNKTVIPTANKAVTIQDSAASFNGAGGVVLSERYLTPQAFMVNEEYDYSVLKQWWFRYLNSAGVAADYDAQASVEEVIMMKIGELNGAFIDRAIWGGTRLAALVSGVTKTGSNQVVGIVDKINAENTSIKATGRGRYGISALTNAASAVVTVTPTPVSGDIAQGDLITLDGLLAGTSTGTDLSTLNGRSFVVTGVSGANITISLDTTGFKTFAVSAASVLKAINNRTVIGAFRSAYEQGPKAVENASDYAFYVDRNTFKALKLAVADVATGSGNYYVGDRPIDFLGVPVLHTPYMNGNTIIAARASDMHFGTNLEGEENAPKIVDLSDKTADYKIRYRVDYGFDVNITNPKDFLIF